jgi:hypothetical protein
VQSRWFCLTGAEAGQSVLVPRSQRWYDELRPSGGRALLTGGFWGLLEAVYCMSGGYQPQRSYLSRLAARSKTKTRSRENVFLRKARTFRRLAPCERALVLEASLLLIIIRITLWLLPFRRVLQLIGISGLYRTNGRSGTPAQLAWSVRLASRWVPNSTCLPQALAMYLLLHRYGQFAFLCLGVASDPKFEAHAWVECDGRIVFGGRETSKNFTKIASFSK